jgi:hypothetical protein
MQTQNETAGIALPIKEDFQVNTLEDADYLFNRIFGFPRPDYPDRRQVCILYMDDNMMLLTSRIFHISEFKGFKTYLREMMHTGLNCGATNVFFAHYSPQIKVDNEDPRDGNSSVLCDTCKKMKSFFGAMRIKLNGYVFYDETYRRVDVDYGYAETFI